MPAKGHQKYDWNAIKVQFLLSDLDDFASFVKSIGLPLNITKSKEAKGISEMKRNVIDREHERARQALIQDPIREREDRRIKTLKQLEDAGRALNAAVMNRIIPDLHLTQRIEGESNTDWANRVTADSVRDKALTPSELMALAAAQKIADELTRKAAGLEDFDWENYEKNQQAVEKSNSLRFEIVSTSGAKPLDQLEYAPEDKKARA